MTAKILHILLLIAVLSSSTGFVLGKHHCQRMEQAESNGEEKVATCADMGGCKKGCCSLEAQYYHLDQDQQVSQIGNDLPTRPEIVPISNVNYALVATTHNNTTSYRNYLSPIIYRNISILFQVFRC